MGEPAMFINRLGQSFVQFHQSMFIQSALLIVVLLILDWILKKRVRAVFRYWVWMLVLLKLVLPVHLALPTSPAYWAQAPVLNVIHSTGAVKSPIVIEAMPVTPAPAQVVFNPPKLAPVADSAEIATPVVASHAVSVERTCVEICLS